VLGKLARQHDPKVLVGFDHADDAGVYQIAPEQALVQTVDFFTPIVDDPYTFGQIAATNSLSDIYAMGGRPITALTLVCYPERADLEILERMLAGGLSKMIEAECTIIGGHSIRDDETKFGYSVTGMIDPKRVLKNGGAQPGDRLLLTKALGTGVISTAIKKGVAKQAWIDAAVDSMTTLNKAAAEVIAAIGENRSERDPAVSDAGTISSRGGTETETGELVFAPSPNPIHALTDITGFGLIGHVREMLLASDHVGAELHAKNLPLLEGALDCIRAGHIPGGLKANREFAEWLVDYGEVLAEEIRTLLFDPQTAGGLLISVAAEQSANLRQGLERAGVPVSEIGEIIPKAGSLIQLKN
jgi:selenide,water dikinase